MPRPKTMKGYPEEYVQVLRSVTDFEGKPFVFPKGFGGYHDVSLRTTFQSFLKAVRNDFKAAPHDPILADLNERSYHAIVRIRNGQVVIEDRRNDRVVSELRALLEERGIVDPVEAEMRREMEAMEREQAQAAESTAEKAENISDERNREFAKFLTRR